MHLLRPIRHSRRLNDDWLGVTSGWRRGHIPSCGLGDKYSWGLNVRVLTGEDGAGHERSISNGQ